jgi:hypothetical protein
VQELILLWENQRLARPNPHLNESRCRLTGLFNFFELE